MNDIIIEEVLKKKPTKSGNGSHIILPKRYEGRTIYILVVADNVIRPILHKNKHKVSEGKTYYQAEVVTNAGTHEVWIQKEKAKELFLTKK